MGVDWGSQSTSLGRVPGVCRAQGEEGALATLPPLRLSCPQRAFGGRAKSNRGRGHTPRPGNGALYESMQATETVLRPPYATDRNPDPCTASAPNTGNH